MAKSIRSKSKRKNRAILRKEVYEPAQRERQATCDKRLLVDTYLKGNKSLDLIGKALTSATPVVDQPDGDVKIDTASSKKPKRFAFIERSWEQPVPDDSEVELAKQREQQIREEEKIASEARKEALKQKKKLAKEQKATAKEAKQSTMELD